MQYQRHCFINSQVKSFSCSSTSCWLVQPYNHISDSNPDVRLRRLCRAVIKDITHSDLNQCPKIVGKCCKERCLTMTATLFVQNDCLKSAQQPQERPSAHHIIPFSTISTDADGVQKPRKLIKLAGSRRNLGTLR